MFKKFNANPKGKKTTDCVIRAVAVATGLGWDETYKQLAEVGFIQKCDMSDLEAVDIVLQRNGFSVGTIRIQKGDKRPTVAQFAEQYPNWYAVLRVANHLVATGKGMYIDTWDSGDCAVYKYWYKVIGS